MDGVSTVLLNFLYTFRESFLYTFHGPFPNCKVCLSSGGGGSNSSNSFVSKQTTRPLLPLEWGLFLGRWT